MEDECDQHSKMFVTGNDRQAGDCNVSSVHWATQDQFFRKSLSDSDFVKRLCYRSSIIHSLKQSIKVLDGLVVEERDRQLSSLHIAKLKKSVRSSGAVFPAVKKSSNVTTSIQLPLQQHRHEDEKENEGVVVPTAASPISSSSSLGYENMDVQSSSHHIMANIMREASSVVQEQQRRTSALAENSLETRLFKNWTPQSYPIERKAQPSNNDGLYFQK